MLNLGLGGSARLGVPQGMSALQALTSLSLHLGWPVGVSNLAGLSRLRRLSLKGHAAQVGELPVGLGALTWLDLGRVAQEAAGSLASLSSLRELLLSNATTALPPGTRALARLTKLCFNTEPPWCTIVVEGWPAEDRLWLEESFGWELSSASHGTVLYRLG